MSHYRILAMDGGGIRGLLTAIILERLERVHPGFLAQVDLFAGTSTGGLLALGLAAGTTPAECRLIYETQGAKAFKDSLLDNVREALALCLEDAAELNIAPKPRVVLTMEMPQNAQTA